MSYNEQDLINEMLNNAAYDADAVQSIAQQIAPIYNEAGREMPKDDEGVYFGWASGKALTMFAPLYRKMGEREDKIEYTESMMRFLSVFNDTQLEVINQNVVGGEVPFEFLDQYIMASIPYGKLNWIFKLIESGHQIYVEENFDKLIALEVDQIAEIFAAFDEGFDPNEIYILTELPTAEKMGLIRHCLAFHLEFEYNTGSGELTIY